MNEIRAISIFIRAATLGNLRKAAVDQGITPQAASHAVMRLEKELGIRLFHRTTRKLSLTEEGQRFFDSVRPAIESLSNAVADARRTKEEVAGPIRVSAPRALGLSVLWPIFTEFSAQYPDVQLDIQFDDHFTDLVSDRADVGFRGGSAPSGGSIARLLAPIQMIVCATPSYLKQHGVPATIDDLSKHRCTGYRRATTGKLAPWEFRLNDESVYLDVPATICTNDIDAEAYAVLSGLGIGQLGSFIATRYIRTGALVPLLVEHIAQRDGIYIYYGHRTEQALRVRTFIDYMISRVAGNREFYLDTTELRDRRYRSGTRRRTSA
ncbi:LysR family transcriptional regulator [Burkholderia ubonensis]|uniref:LysR family transcriptional regulator n=1 Tax=Burkholderia ubonensis TaxID=101571 RepID=A0AB73FU51_9BURK|nr:LysR family transcriptional regulator [Burkholderia ubonensis]KVK74435.1 LysR family transcriptional regulator [Burkholderia ubonensis]KVL75492.1 LysR family transcriptional regulator [Burkholderia ubonensis]KVM21111.1 LysR family transcriptional regulator [Burkholderia ubonensis]KVM29928.1 LysR family transcriptional regulator [Burkholderia ubonensis]